ncbi:unnamed protein product [Dibothriocephalus latus]|uniref:Uncharacterized protein n=1 Tax=Dibothriocephalus latus TaxID=60516 RepID=A0A3P7LMS3_DIBLA|nr:unnamed protein product [Dibothriocephalus latus]
MVIARDNKTTFLTTETQPKCQWSSEWMNKHSIFKVTGTASSNSDGAVEHRTMVCAYSKSNLKRNATYEVAIVARENVQLRLTYNGHAFTKDEQPVECYTYPTFPSEKKYIRWEIIQEHPHFKVDRNKLVPSNLHVRIKDHTYGSYVCVFETEGIFLTQVFFVLTYVEMEKVKILPQKREFETGDMLSCTSTAARTAYHILDVSMAYSNVRLISRKSGAFQVVTDTLYSVRVSSEGSFEGAISM